MKKIVALVLSLVMVLGLATTAFAVVTPTFEYWDATAKEFKDTGVTFTPGTDLDDLVADDDNYLACYEISGDFYVEVPAAAATHKLVYGAKTVNLVEVPENTVRFEDKAQVLTVVEETYAECGDYYVADAVYDEDDVYYVSFDKKGVVDGIWVEDETSTENVLVNGKLVAVEDAMGYVDFLYHAFKGNEVVNYAYVNVKCEECGKVATLYANADAAGKLAQTVPGVVGYITYADYMDFGAVAAPEAGDKVESAETFDAGIAMYVGMSVMAAAGSAVVLKKKD